LSKALGVPPEVLVAATTGELTDAVSNGTIDIGFMPADDERRQRLDFSPAYFIIENAYLVAPGSDIKTIADADRADVTIVGVANSTTIRAAGRVTKNAKIVAAKTVDEAVDALKSEPRRPSRSPMTRCRRSSRRSPARAFSTAPSGPPVWDGMAEEPSRGACLRDAIHGGRQGRRHGPPRPRRSPLERACRWRCPNSTNSPAGKLRENCRPTPAR
jgi:hypothetical protein